MKNKAFLTLLILVLPAIGMAQERFSTKKIFWDNSYTDTLSVTSTGIDTSVVFDLWSFTSVQFCTDKSSGGTVALKITVLGSNDWRDASFKPIYTVSDSVGVTGWYAPVGVYVPTCRFGKFVIEGLTTNVNSRIWGWTTGWSSADGASGRM